MLTPESLDPIRNDGAACGHVRSTGWPAAPRFGRRSEKLADETVQQASEDLEQSVAEKMAGLEAAAKARTRLYAGKPAKRNRGALPAHVPRVEVMVDVEDKACACCGGSLHQIGEDQAEMLDYVPAQFRVRLIRRPRYGCRACENSAVQAPAPDRPIDGGMATEALVAQVLIGKYGAHLPLYRNRRSLPVRASSWIVPHYIKQLGRAWEQHLAV